MATLFARCGALVTIVPVAIAITVAFPVTATAERPDSDGDGLYDDDEAGVYFTDPANPDTDGDGSDDGQEVYDGTDPLSPSGQLPPQAGPKPTPDNSPPAQEPLGERTVVFEITGSGTVYSIDFDPAGEKVGENTAVPFKRSLKIGPNIILLTVNAVTKTGSQGCRILLDGKVVSEQPAPNSFCTFSIP
jgi:hypothetical protein